MLVVDASCLYEVLVGSPNSEAARAALAADTDHAAPHIVDVEVLGVVRRDLRLGRVDPTAASQAVEDLRDWPGERYGHRSLLERAFELRENMGTWDAMYVALAEVLDATLLTFDHRLAEATGPRCQIRVLDAEN
jgi:predicted nucleic acid-binding protein